MGAIVGSYLESEVSLLLSDAPSAKYADYLPNAEYCDRLRAYAVASADVIAMMVGALAERILQRRGTDVVLVSIARAGTPVGVLVKRWLAFVHGLDVRHFSISIANGVVDESALSWLTRRCLADRLQFIDGWTSKGTVARLLHRTCRADRWSGIDPTLAVVVDPVAAAGISATRDDVLLPHACLGAQMSGLLGAPQHSSLAGRRLFHGVDVRRDLRGQDLTRWYLDQVEARFGAVRTASTLRSEDGDHSAGIAQARLRQSAVVAARLGLGLNDPINVGTSEAARALFRPNPRQLVVRSKNAATDLLCDVAEQRNVPIELDPSLLVDAIAI